MKRRILIVLAVCAFSAAMVPKERRAVNEEEEPLHTQTISTGSTDKPKEVCAPQTTCAWSFYKPTEYIITNTYCDCGPGTVCQATEDDTTVYAYILRCRAPVDGEDGDS